MLHIFSIALWRPGRPPTAPHDQAPRARALSRRGVKWWRLQVVCVLVDGGGEDAKLCKHIGFTACCHINTVMKIHGDKQRAPPANRPPLSHACFDIATFDFGLLRLSKTPLVSHLFLRYLASIRLWITCIRVTNRNANPKQKAQQGQNNG